MQLLISFYLYILGVMPALDLFSAASRPMPPGDFDSGPSKPLNFAATLHSRDINVDHPRLPKPRREKEDHQFPTSPYSHARHGSAASLDDFKALRIDHAVGSDEWMQAEVARCVDQALGTLDLKYVGLSTRTDAQCEGSEYDLDQDCRFAQRGHSTDAITQLSTSPVGPIPFSRFGT